MEIMKNPSPHKRTAEEEEETLTELTLGYGHGVRVMNKKKPRTAIAAAIRLEEWYKEEEERVGISLRLRLYDDPWKIKKKLTKSDVGKLSRLLLKTELVEAHIMRFWDADRIAEASTPLGTQVKIHDLDTDNSGHELTFKRWCSSNSYVINNNWNKEFVTRRVLREGDEIGFFWNGCNSHFCFSVLTRAA